VLADSAGIVAAGIAVGLVISLAATRLLAGFLYGITPTDARTLASAVAVLGITAMVAAYLPSRRAAGVDPALVLRS